jgi:tetratricopeptide (TPR) repeat protein
MRLFGIDAERQVLARALSELESGSGGIVLVRGEAGAGKTALLSELAATGSAHGFKVINSGTSPAPTATTESLWLSILQACAEDDDYHSLERGEDPSQLQSRSHDPRIGYAGSLDQLEVNAGIEAGTAAFSRISSALRSAAELQPILLIFDDLALLDDLSLSLIADLVQDPGGGAILMVAAYRISAFDDQARAAVLDKIKRQAYNIELTSMSHAVIEEFLTRLIGHRPQPRLVERMQQLTGGNPRLIAESAPLLFDGGELLTSPSGLSTIPLGISIAVHEYLDGVSPSSIEFLKFAAVIGGRFDPELAAEIAGSNRDEALAALSALENRSIIVAESDHHYRFAQGFTREVLYRELPADLRAQTHRRIGAMIEAQHAQDIEPFAEDVAHNLLLSREGRAIEEAVGYAEMAARRFQRAGAYAKAAEMYSLALEAVRWRGSEDDLRFCDILTAKGIAQRDAGHLREAEKTFQNVVTYARRIGDPVRMGQLALEVPEYHWPLPGWESPLAILLAEGALSALGTDDSAPRAALLGRLAAELSYDRSQKARCNELAKTSIEIAQRVGADPVLMLRLLRYKDCTLRHPDYLQERLLNLSRVTALARQVSDNAILHEAAAASIAALFTLGKISEAEALFSTYVETARIANRPLYSIFVHVSLAGRATIMGQSAECEKLFNEARSAAEEFGIPEAVERCWPVLILPMVERDTLTDLQPLAAASLRTRPNSVEDRALKCWLDARVGRHFEARLRLERLMADDLAEVRDDQNVLVAACALGEACIRLGSEFRHHAERVYDLLLPYADLEVALGQIAAMSSVSYYLGRLAKYLARRDAAIDHLATAVDLHAKLESRPFTLYATFEEAEALLGHRDSQRRSYGSTLLTDLEKEMTGGEMPELAKRASELRAHGVAVDPVNGGSKPANGNGIHAGLMAEAQSAEPEGQGGAPNTTESRVFKRQGDVWTLSYEGRVARVPHLKGLTLISHLLARPNEPVHCMELGDSADGARRLPGEVLPLAHVFEMGPATESGTKQSYRDLARELRDERETAIRSNDTRRVEKIDNELRLLTRDLARAIGLYGQDRFDGSSGERARLRVAFAIKSAIGKIATPHPDLARHLASSIKTGKFCVYRSDSKDPGWELNQP